MSYVTNDVNALQSAMVENVVEMVTESVILIASIVMMIYLDWRLFLVTFSTFPVVLLFIDQFGKRIRKSGSRIQEATADIISVLQETVSSARVIKSFVRSAHCRATVRPRPKSRPGGGYPRALSPSWCRTAGWNASRHTCRKPQSRHD